MFVLFKASYRLCVSGTEAFEQRAKETLTSRTFFFSQVLENNLTNRARNAKMTKHVFSLHIES